MDLAAWKERINESLWNLRFEMESLGAKSLSGLMAASAFWPVLEAAQKGDFEAAMAFGRLSGEIGSNLLADKFKEWNGGISSKEESVQVIEADLEASPALQEEVDRLLEKLEVLAEALERQKEDRSWFEAHLREELETRGKAHVVDTLIEQNVQNNTGTVIGRVGTYIAGNTDSSTDNEVDPAEEARIRYLEGVHRTCVALPLATFGRKNKGKRFTLRDVYIELNTETLVDKQGRLIREAGQHAMDEETFKLTAQKAVECKPRTVLLGDPGSGKSTFLRHYLAETCRTCLSNEDGQDYLPVLIVLRELTVLLQRADLPSDWQRREEALVSLVREYALENVEQRYDASAYAPAFREALSSGHCILAFDGLDEVPIEQRPLLRDAILAAANAFNPHRLLVTSRWRSYHGDAVLEDVDTYRLAPLEPDQVGRFAKAWYNANHDIGQYSREEAQERGENLAEATRHTTIRPLAKNPMLLTTLAVVHEQDNKLPQRRVALYDRAIDVLLTGWQESKEKLKRALVTAWPHGQSLPDDAVLESLVGFLEDRSRTRPVLEKLAFLAHRADAMGDGKQAADIDWSLAVDTLTDQLKSRDLAAAFLRYVDDRAGLLVANGDAAGRPASYSFAHRTFQEYLAGCHLLKQRESELVRALCELAEQGDRWGLAVQLAGEEIMYNRPDENRLFDLAAALRPHRVESMLDNRLTLWSAWLAAILGADKLRINPGLPQKESGSEFLDRLREQVSENLGRLLPPAERAEMGRALAMLGDPRPETMTLEGMTFCYVPPGPFMMGDKGREVDVPYGYWISRYPVTQAQFAEFTSDGGYETEQCWTKVGWKERQSRAWKKPDGHGEPFDLSNHPVIGVSLYEAAAFTIWLNETMHSQLPAGWTFNLPNDPEWEKAARGGMEISASKTMVAVNEIESAPVMSTMLNPVPVRRFAWEDEKADPERMNYAETEVGTTTACGCFPLGESPVGAREMNGQVWEWTRSKHKTDYNSLPATEWSASEELEDLSNDDFRVFRGGAFVNVDRNCRCAYRHSSHPDLRYYGLGFRLVLLPVSALTL